VSLSAHVPRTRATPAGGSSPRRRARRSATGRDGPPQTEAGQPTARGGSARSRVAEIQCARMIAAMADLAWEQGVSQVTVSHVVARSGVSRRTFYELFDDREDCFLAAFEEAVARAAERVVPAFTAATSWREQVRGGLGALLEFVDDEPGLSVLCIVDALGAGPRALTRRAAVVQTLIDAVDEGRGVRKGGAQPTRLVSEGVVGAVLALLHARLSERRLPLTSELLSPLMGIVVLPYLGAAAAAREAARPTAPRDRASRAHGDPLQGLDMRLTYRTVRVLLAIAARPEASNRQIADAAGVADQGQISKLLTRLEHLGLIANAGAAPGEPNVWSLTARGREVEETISRTA
jgi:AcrR family transcriptional regulator